MTRARTRRSASGRDAQALRLDAGVYTEASLLRTRTAFAHLAQIEIRSRGGSWIVGFRGVDPDLRDRLPDEFANHALSCLMVDR